METRRSFLRNSALALAGGLAAPSVLSSCAAPAPAAPAPKEFIGLQTYSLGQELAQDVPGVLKQLAEAGYTDLELAGYNNGQIAGMACAEFKKLCDDNGLKITSTHLSNPTQYQQDEATFTEAWKKCVEDHAMMGCKWMVDPSMPQIPEPDVAKLVGDRFNLAGKICKEAGMMFGYHNHSNEFTKVATAEEKQKYIDQQIERMKQRDPNYKPNEQQLAQMMSRANVGKFIEELFIENTDPSLVCFELDCYWCVRGGQDPLYWLTKFPDRFKLLHVKDDWIIGGSGMMNWENIFNTAKEIGIHDWYVELERSQSANGRTQLVGVLESAKYLNSKEFVW